MKSEMKGSEKEYASVLRIIVQRRAKALSNVNAQNLLTNWEIGAFISRRLANSAWGSAAVDGLVDYIHSHDPTAKGNVQPTAGQLSDDMNFQRRIYDDDERELERAKERRRELMTLG